MSPMPPSLPPAARRALPRGMALAALLGCCALPAATAWAAPPPVQVATPDLLTPDQTGAGTAGGLFAQMDRSSYLLGTMGGLRTQLSRYGISLGLLETTEVLGNVTGGSRRGAAYDGLTQAVMQIDTQRAFGWHGGTFNISALQIHGSNLSASNLLTLQTASGIEADPATRLWEIWYQQKFLEEDRLDVKIGEQSLDQEFMVSQNALSFVNTMFGWPMLPSADLPGGGAAYPLASLGVRVRYRPVDSLVFLAGIFNGSPVASNNGDPQRQNPSGTSFPVHGGALLIAELQYSYPSLGAMVNAGETPPLARVYKLGFFYDTENFADQAFDNLGQSLASPASNGVPLLHHGDLAFYGVADEIIWQDPKEGDRTLSVFARALGSPDGNRNLISYSFNAGITLHDPLPHRDDDLFGIGMGLAHVSNGASALDEAENFYNDAGLPIRGSETFFELTYQYALTPWWQLQPDLQYVLNPGGGIVNPNNPPQPVKNELVLGLRTNIVF